MFLGFGFAVGVLGFRVYAHPARVPGTGGLQV